MCDEESSGLQNILQSNRRREPKIILERGEYIFRALKNNLVSVFVFFVHRTVNYKSEFAENYFWKLLPYN